MWKWEISNLQKILQFTQVLSNINFAVDQKEKQMKT